MSLEPIGEQLLESMPPLVGESESVEQVRPAAQAAIDETCALVRDAIEA